MSTQKVQPRWPDGANAPTPQRPRLGDILRAQGQISEDDLEKAVSLHTRADIRLGDAVRATGKASPEAVQRALETQWQTRHIDLAATPPDPTLTTAVGPLACLEDRTMPWRRVGGRTVVVTEDPSGFEMLKDRFEETLGPVMMALAERGTVAEALAVNHKHVLLRRAETRVAPLQSCRTWRAMPFRVMVTWAAFISGGVALFSPTLLLLGLLALSVLSLVALTGFKLSAAITQWRPERAMAEVRDLKAGPGKDRLPVISILVPLYQEDRIAGHLMERLGRLDYPRALLDVCIVVEEDDTITCDAVAATELPQWMRMIVVPQGTVKTKPRAMNYALDFCHGSIVGIYDAEDAPAPDQLRRVAERFAVAGPQVACLQGALDFYNTRHNWMSRCFTLEYATWFRVLLPGVARLGWVVPLGGTTLFFRRSVLEELGAWDAHNVTEDADLGVRIARRGYRTELLDTTTREEANCRPWPWVKQRSRWLKGYAMTYAVHMRDPVALWRDLGPWQFFGFQVLFLGSLTQVALAPVLWSLWALFLTDLHPLAHAMPTGLLWGLAGLFVLSELVTTGLALRALQITGRLSYGAWALTMAPYFAMATLAVYKAFGEMLHRPFFWDKTQHGRFTEPTTRELSFAEVIPAEDQTTQDKAAA
ncbi:MAG: glycosyltransferase [Pseudomonadota bacterium]